MFSHRGPDQVSKHNFNAHAGFLSKFHRGMFDPEDGQLRNEQGALVDKMGRPLRTRGARGGTHRAERNWKYGFQNREL